MNVMRTGAESLLKGVRVLEVGGIGPVPHAGMLFAGLGADVVRVERDGQATTDRSWDGTRRGRALVTADLKDPDDLEHVCALAELADVLIEGFRPGVAERMGIGPNELQRRNPRLIYARMTGWGQHGPLADRAGHDINYIGLTGALHAIGADQPIPPLNLLGDFGGGSLYLALGVTSALFRRNATGQGCILDAAIVDGVSSLMQLIWSLQGDGRWHDSRRCNLLDGGTPYYQTYRCADGGWMAVGALEPAFYAQLLSALGLRPDDLPDRADVARWPELERVFSERFVAHPRAHWERVFDGTDACVTPVLSMAEAPHHPHNVARNNLPVTEGGILASVAPRVSGRPPAFLGPSAVGDLTAAVARWARGSGS